MKKLISLAALVFTAGSLHAAELQLFEKYDPTTHAYASKQVSSTEAPLDAEYLLGQYGVCYKGEQSEVLALVDTMVDLFNNNPLADRNELLVLQSSGFVTLEDGQDYLTMSFQLGRQIITFPQVRKCIR